MILFLLPCVTVIVLRSANIVIKLQKIKFKKLTELYKGSLMYIASELLESQQEQNELRKVFKQLEKGV